jgi:hypothetical protein
VISTDYLSEKDIKECMYINSLIHRLFDPIDCDNNDYELKNTFYNKKDKLQLTYVNLLEKIINNLNNKSLNIFGYDHHTISDQLEKNYLIKIIEGI